MDTLKHGFMVLLSYNFFKAEIKKTGFNIILNPVFFAMDILINQSRTL